MAQKYVAGCMFNQTSDRYKIILGLLMCVAFLHTSYSLGLALEDWTWLYHKTITNQEMSQALSGEHQKIIFTKTDVPAFTQLLFSWNALRPKKGYFSFLVQSRDSVTQEWDQWHKMFEWGDDIQRSFTSKGKNSRYEYVRLEIEKNKKADGFKVKIQAHDGASLQDLKALSINAANLDQCKTELIDSYKNNLSSIHITGVPKRSQFMLDHPKNDVLCSPTSSSMLLGFLTKEEIDPLDFAHKSFDTGLGVYGSWPFNTAHAFERSGGKISFATVRLPSFMMLHDQLKRGSPVVVSVRGPLVGSPRPYNHGHLLVVVGWDAKKNHVICHDPAMSSDHTVEKRYDLATFLAGWERSKRLAYIALSSQNIVSTVF